MTQLKNVSTIAAGLLAGAVLFTPPVSQAAALHGWCAAPTAPCADNGTVTPVSSNTPTYGFWAASGPLTGTFEVVTLIPNNLAGAGSEIFSVNGTAAVLTAGPAWTSGKLASYLGLSGGASPANPIDAFLTTTQTFDAGATGYFVYVANLGVNTLAGAPGSAPILNDGAFFIPTGSSIVGFLDVGASTSDWIATANSAQLSIQGGASVPEPATLSLLGLGLAAVGFMRRRKAA